MRKNPRKYRGFCARVFFTCPYIVYVHFLQNKPVPCTFMWVLTPIYLTRRDVILRLYSNTNGRSGNIHVFLLNNYYHHSIWIIRIFFLLRESKISHHFWIDAHSALRCVNKSRKVTITKYLGHSTTQSLVCTTRSMTATKVMNFVRVVIFFVVAARTGRRTSDGSHARATKTNSVVWPK